jgi:preprotein translocase subunit SecD
MILLLALLLAGQAAPPPCPADASPDEKSAQHERHGNGLWIGGIAFVPADLAAVVARSDKYSGEPTILITFTDGGRAKFAAAQACRLGHPIEIWIDGDLVSRPYLEEQIDGPQIEVHGSWNAASASAFVERILAAKP